MEPLAPGMRRAGAMMRRLPGSSVSLLTREQVELSHSRKTPEAFASFLLGKLPGGVRYADRSVGNIPIRVYTPKVPATGLRAVVVYFHGGGFVFGDLRGGDWLCGTVCRDLDAIVVSVDYRLAPENPFPAGPDDCLEVTKWVAEHAAELGADDGRLGVMGDSAGGNLAAVVSLLAADAGPRIRHQALIYPATGGGDTESRRANASAVILTADDMRVFGELYGGDPTDWRVSPLLAKSLKGQPPAIVIVGGHDPLHDDGTLYADALRKAGVAVELRDYPSMPHGFISFPRFARDAKPAVAAIVEAQRVALA